MKNNSIKNKQITDEAANWAIWLDNGPLTASQNKELATWLLESPAHVEELLLSAAIFSGLEDVDPQKTISIDDLLKTSAPNVIPMIEPIIGDAGASNRSINIGLPEKKTNTRSRKVLTAVLGIAATFLLVISGVGLWSNQTPLSATSQSVIAFNTQLGEQRSMTLEDGSIVHVNTQSEIKISFAKDQRLVTLISGEALFEVAHNPSRPFRVIAGDTIAEAIGTTFNVYRNDNGTNVAVIEGRVAVETNNKLIEKSSHINNDALKNSDLPVSINHLEDGRLLLDAGQSAKVLTQDKVVEISMANIDTVSSWRTRKLVFDSEKLGTIIREFNRYNRTQIVITDKELAEIEFSGRFAADDPQSLIAFLRLSDDIIINYSSNEIELSSTVNK